MRMMLAEVEGMDCAILILLCVRSGFWNVAACYCVAAPTVKYARVEVEITVHIVI